MFIFLHNNKTFLAFFLIITIFSLTPTPTYAGGGGSGGIFSIIVSVVVAVVAFVVCDAGCAAAAVAGLAGESGALTLASYAIAAASILAGPVGTVVAVASAIGSAVNIAISASNLSSSSEISNPSPDQIKAALQAEGVGVMGTCPEGYYNSQNKICVPVGQQSCLDVGIRGSCPAGYSCSASYGGSCWPGRAKQPSVIIDFSVDKPEPSINEVVNFTWNSTGATSCVLNQNIGGVYATGTLPIILTKLGIYDFVIRCAGEGGELKKIITIDIPPVITNLTSDKTFTAIKDSFTLTWASQNAQACSLDNNIGTVPLSGNGYFHFDSTGDKSISFICNGRGGTSTSTVAITALTQTDYQNRLSGQTSSNVFVQASQFLLNLVTSTTNTIVAASNAILESLTSVGNFFNPVQSTSVDTGQANQGTQLRNDSNISGYFPTSTPSYIASTSSPSLQPPQPTTRLIFSGGSGGQPLDQQLLTGPVPNVAFGGTTNLLVNPTVRDGTAPGAKALNPNEPLEVDWSFPTASSCSVGNNQDTQTLNIPPAGAVIVHPVQTTTYTIACIVPNAAPIVSTQTVYVKSVPGFIEVPPQ